MKITYAILLNFTEQGARNVKDSAKRAKAFRHGIESKGVNVLTQLWTTGAYDGLLILEGDSEEKVLSAVAQLSSEGNVRTHSLRAFEADDFARITGA